jgi:hypothetical protein
MNMQSIAVLGNRQFEILGRTERTLTVGSGKRYALYWLESGKLVGKHVLSGRFRSEVKR